MVDPIGDGVELVEHITSAATVDPVSGLLVAAGSLILAGSILVALWLVIAAAVDAVRSVAA